MTRDEFYDLLTARGLVLTTLQKEQFQRFFELLVDWNQRMNLTGITEEMEVYAKHFYDSLDPFLEFDMTNTKTVCDVGTGAGFPGMPLAIAYPDVRFDLIDSLGKRVDFLNFSITELGLKNAEAHHVRAEDFAKKKRETFNLVTSRAVARLNILVELCAPLVKVGGSFITLKGPAGYEELLEAKQGPLRLGVKHKKSIDVDINGVGARVNLYFEKIEVTPKKYPRPFGQIKKKPLS